MEVSTVFEFVRFGCSLSKQIYEVELYEWAVRSLKKMVFQFCSEQNHVDKKTN